MFVFAGHGLKFRFNGVRFRLLTIGKIFTGRVFALPTRIPSLYRQGRAIAILCSKTFSIGSVSTRFPVFCLSVSLVDQVTVAPNLSRGWGFWGRSIRRADDDFLPSSLMRPPTEDWFAGVNCFRAFRNQSPCYRA